MNCSDGGIAVAKRTYEALDQLADADDVADLIDYPCILVEKSPSVRYASPHLVVQQPGALRGYLDPLPPELAGYRDFAANVGLTEEPGAGHAIHVLQEIGASTNHVDS